MKTRLVLPTIRGVIGDWVYYSSVLTAQQVSEWIEPAKEIREATSLDEVLQRDLKERKKVIAKYLLTNEHRFFNTIIVGVYGGIPEWIQFDISEKLEELQGSADAHGDAMGILIMNGTERMFAIDGQHRTAGIDIASKDINASILDDDRFSVMFIAHIDDEKGRRRTRRLFSDINQKAVAVPKKDQIIIDEEKIQHIVTRRLYAEYKYFNNGKLIDHYSETSNLDKDDEQHFTNLTNLDTVVTKLKPLYKKQRGSKEWELENVNALYAEVTEFFDWIIAHKTELSDFFINHTLTLGEARFKNRYLLFRPIGLTLLTRIYVYFAKNNLLDELQGKINKLNFVMPESHFNKVLWNNSKMEAKAQNQTTAYHLALYLLGHIQVKKESLLTSYRDILKNDAIDLPEPI